MNIQKMVLVPLEKYERMKSCSRKDSPDGASVRVIMEDRTAEEKADPLLDKEKILQAIPKMYKTKGQALLGFIENGNILSWNEKGEIQLRGQTIKNSHIADLLKDAMREYKDFNPIGKDEFYKGLAQSNVPLLLIENRDNRQRLLNGKSESDLTTKYEMQSERKKATSKPCRKSQLSKWIHI